MKYLLVALMVTLCAVTAKADILTLYPANTVTIPTCSSGGGTSVSVPKGFYQIHVSVATANVCYAETCVTGGMERVKGNHGTTYLPEDTSVSCRSAAGGVVQFVPGGRIK